MKKLIAKLLLGVLFMLGMVGAHAQSIANYTFSTNAIGSLALDMNGNTIDMTSGTTTLIGAGSIAGAGSGLFNIGFDFLVMGTRNTQFSVSSHGWLGIGASLSNGNGWLGGGTAGAPRVAPFLVATTAGGFVQAMGTSSTGKIHYKIVGTSPNRTLVIEYLNMQINSTLTGSSADATFQARLYESTGVMEFVYGLMTVGAGSAAILGNNVGWSNTSAVFSSINTATHTASTAATTTQTLNAGTITDVSSVANGSRRVYRYTPVPLAAPTSLTFSAITGVSYSLNWLDNSTGELGFEVYRSTDGINYTFMTRTAANALTFAATGLLPGITYQWRVTAVLEGPSTALAGSQATNAAGNISSTGAGGNWSATGTWVGGVVPTVSDNVTIVDGSTVTIDVAAVANTLTVGQGTSGILQYEAVTARTLTVNSNVTIAVGGTFQTAASGAVTTHALSLAGNLINNGTLDFSTFANAAGGNITFTGATNNLFSGTGGTTDLRNLTITKGSGTITLSSPVLDMNLSNLTVRGLGVDPTGFLTLNNGIFKVSGANAISSVVFLTAGYSIASTAGFWLNNANFTVAGLNGSPTMSGLLRITNGIMNIGAADPNIMGGAATSIFIVEGGIINIASRLVVASSGASFNMSAGTINVTTVANTTSASPGFGFTSATSLFTMSGGVINLIQRSTGATILDYNVATTSPAITGGTLNVGIGATATNFNFGIQGTMPNVVVDNTTNNKTANLVGTANVYGNLTITSGATFSGVASTINMIGNATNIGNVINNGTITNTSAANANRFGFSSTFGVQNYSGAGIFGTAVLPYAGLNLSNPAGVTFSSPVIAARANLFTGTYAGTNITLGGTTNSPLIQIGGTVTINAGSFSSAPTLDVTAGNLSLLYSTALSAVTTGPEIPASRTVSSLSISNANGVTLTGGTLLTTGATGFTLSSGVINTTGTNRLILASTVTTIPAGSATSYVSGPLEIQTAATAVDISRTYPIGIAGAFRPLSINTFNNNNTAQNYVAEAISGATGGTGTGFNLTNARYYRIQNTANIFSIATARIVLSYGADDNIGTLATVVVGQSATAAGAYANDGQSANTASTITSNAATAVISAGGDYFVLGNTAALPVTWDGGAATNNWGDAANWSPDGVPTNVSNVTLTAASATIINVNIAAAAVNDITFGSNMTLNLTSNTLTVNGNFNQGGSILNSGNGVLDVKGNFTRTAGTFTAGTGTTSFTGAAQAINATGSATTFNNLSLSGGTKTFTTGATYAAAGNVIVAADALLALSAATATTINIAGNLSYSAAAGGVNLGSLTLNLTGIANTLSAGTGLAIPNISIGGSAVYSLLTNLEVPTGRTFTLGAPIATYGGRLNSGGFVVSGAGTFTFGTNSIFGVFGAAGQYNTELTMATVGFPTNANTAFLEYYAGANQNIDVAAHNARCGIRTSGSGTKTLTGNIALDGSSASTTGPALLDIGAGTTFVDNGFTVSFSNLASGYGNVTVNGIYSSTGTGGFTYPGLSNLSGSSISFVNGTTFGDITLNTAASTGGYGLYSLPASTTVSASMRNANFGGVAGGTFVLNASGITNINVTGNIVINPSTVTNTGGGFGGVAATTGTVRVKGNISSTSTSTSFLLMNNTGTNTLILDGSPGAQTITLAANSTSFMSGATLRVENTTGLTLGSALTMAGTLNMANGTLTTGANNFTLGAAANAIFGPTSVLNINNAASTVNFATRPVTLQSTTLGTARIATIAGALTLAGGATNVTMERFIKLRAGGVGRAYRLLAPTVNTTGTMRANWMEGGMNLSPGVNVNPLPGYGTHITGASGNTNFFDATATNASSAYFITNGVTPAYTAIGSTQVGTGIATMNALTGYFLYVRGDRSMNLTLPLNPATNPTSSTTLRTTGTLLTGTKTEADFAAMDATNLALNLVTNPYASPIDWSLVRGDAGTTNLSTSYTVWDANLGSRGGFATVTTGGVASGGSAATVNIQPGQAFFVQTSGGVPTIAIKETHKVAGNNNAVFLVPPQTFGVALYYNESTGYRRQADGVIAMYDNNYSTAIDADDAAEINNWDENIAIARDGKHLAIEARPVIVKSDDLPLFMDNMKKQGYEFEFTPASFTNTNLKAELVDNYLGTRTLLSVINPTTVAFTITADPASAATDRFKVVFGAFGSPQGVDAITIKATQQNGGVQVDWTSKTETDMVKYEVEKQTYGTTYSKVNTTNALGNSANPVNYNWFDTNPVTGYNFYRVKGIDKAGNVRYSDMVKVLFGKGEPGIVVYPNPVEGDVFKVDLNNLAKGTYLVNLYNTSGQKVYTGQIQHDGSILVTKVINLNSDVSKGVYQLQLSSDNGFKTTQKIIKN